MTLTFDLWSQKLISTSTNPNKSVTKIGWNFFHWVVKWCSQGFRVIACWDLDVWPFDLISRPMSLAQVHTWPIFGESCSHIYGNNCFCDLDLSVFDPKIEPAYLRMQIHLWPELGKIGFTGMGNMVSSACRDLDLSPFDVISMSQAQVHTWPIFGESTSYTVSYTHLTLPTNREV